MDRHVAFRSSSAPKILTLSGSKLNILEITHIKSALCVCGSFYLSIHICVAKIGLSTFIYEQYYRG